MEQELTYNQALAQLEALVKKMQAPDCDIDNLSAFTSQALKLLKFCKDKLTVTDQKVKQVLDSLSDDKSGE